MKLSKEGYKCPGSRPIERTLRCRSVFQEPHHRKKTFKMTAALPTSGEIAAILTIMPAVLLVSGGVIHKEACGRALPSSRRDFGRVVGGVESVEGEFPWMVSFKNFRGHFCGGFVISDKYILTAAHCFLNHEGRKRSVKDVSASIGEWSLHTPEKGHRELDMEVEEVVLHPSYTSHSRTFDIALVKLKESVRSHPTVEPICLPSQKSLSLEPEAKVTTAGWGKTSFHQSMKEWGREVDVLRKVDVSLWDTSECVEVYKSFHNFPNDSFLCAGDKGGQSCVGDSGGPLMVLRDGRWVALGVVSVGEQCGEHGKPSVYTDVAEYLPWVQSVIQ